MESIREAVTLLSERISGLEPTKGLYSYPYPQKTVVRGVIKNSPAHKGSFRGALDFLVDLGTPILSPAAGVITEIIDNHDKFGPTEEFVGHLNYITIKHSNGEYSQLAHLARGSSRVRVGQKVGKGEKVAVTGQSGWMTEPHLHMLIFRKNSKSKEKFKGLSIRFKK